MFFVTTDQNDMKICIMIAHIVAMIEHEANSAAEVLTQVITTGQVGDDVQSFFVKCTADEAMAKIAMARN
jgi:hypothetical protein